MSSFTQALLVTTGKSSLWRPKYKCVGGFKYDIGYLGSGLSVVVADGFESDGPSVPWWCLWFIKLGCMIKSAIIHDALRKDLRFSLVEGNAIFFAAMEAEGTPKWQRWICLLAVSTNKNR